MKERPILFKDEMIRAILDGRKTQTRRLVKLPKNHVWGSFFDGQICPENDLSSLGYSVDELRCPYGKPGDRIWVRETHAIDGSIVRYHATDNVNELRRKRPSIHMPRWASRIMLEITGVRVERLRDISYQDAQAEGVQTETADPWFYHISTERNVYDFAADEPQGSFRKLWESINGAGSWNANPWVWVIEFKRVPS